MNNEIRESYPIRDWENSYRVFALQNMLHYLGFNQGRDGIYGPNTKANVKKFQRMLGLAVDGIPGIETMQKLAEECIYKEK